MRHLFFVHSSITYLIARQVITHERLPPSDCLLLLLRGFRPDPDDPIAAAPLTPVPVPLSPRFWQVWRSIDDLDRRIAELTDHDDFTLYAPHTDNSTVRLLYTHPRCRALSYVEEGSASYIPRERWRKAPSFLNRVVRRLYSRNRYPELNHFEDFYQNAYCISEHCFPGMPRKVVLPLPFHRITVDPSPTGQAVLVMDAIVEFNLLPEADMHHALNVQLDWFLTHGHQRVFYKYHPKQAQDPTRRAFYEQQVFGPYRHRLQFTELPATTSLEDLAFSYPNVTFAIATSSVGLYAAFCQQRVVSVAKILAARSDTFARRLALLPPVFFDLTEFLPAD